MLTIQRDVITPSTSDAFVNALEQVLLHMRSALSEAQQARAADCLEAGNVLRAAEILATTAAASERTLSPEDRATLRTVLDSHAGDRAHTHG